MELDFSRLDSLAYRGFTSEAGKETRDTLIEQGFMVIEDDTSPFNGLEALEGANTPTQALKRKLEPLAGIPTGRNYPAMYEAASGYHERHAPQLTPGYWGEAVKDLSAVARQFDNDPFMIALLNAVYGEMERGYNTLQGNDDSKQKSG